MGSFSNQDRDHGGEKKRFIEGYVHTTPAATLVDCSLFFMEWIPSLREDLVDLDL